ncbi:MAG: F0F1 ATP synthase subunit epsilon [Phycisphaeraceae bacterium]|nr:MAG: F0F1 ATP synthase subunit epsilon [Phycisphaeraceae bacterium]
MAGKSFRCRLITPEARLIDDDVTYAQLPLWDGQAGILYRRAPLMAKLGMGELRLDYAAGGAHSYLIEDGFVQMVGDTLTLLAQRAIPVERINEEEARTELAEAEARKPQGADDQTRVTRDRDRARLKIRLAQQFKARGGGI